MLYLIGLGLNTKGITAEGIDAIKVCKKIYLENYTVDFPYSLGELNETIDRKMVPAGRNFIESMKIIDEAKKMNVALLVYGSPLTATTHISLVDEAKKTGIKCKIIYSASIIDAVGETGLQIYKFGKITSMPAWNERKNFAPDSFIKIILENQSIKAHSLILIDIGLEFKDALKQLICSSEKEKLRLDKIIVCQCLGTRNQRIFYKNINSFKEYSELKKPYCIIIPGELHFVEKEILESF